ncbi:MAG: radical SAM protein [bacterium]|nr:radical SAM protein [bacterium]
MTGNFLLISVAGLPKILSDFIPDIGLGVLASSLINEGWRVKILDFNQPSLFSEVFTDEISSFLERFSHKVFIEGKSPSLIDIAKLKLIDKRLEKNKEVFSEKLQGYIENFVEKEKIDCVGFKLWAGDGFRWSLNAGGYLKKKHPELKIIGGGPQVDIFGEEIYKVGGFFDALCYGEGEETIIHLADYVAGKKRREDIPNIIFRKEETLIKTPRKFIEDLDNLPIAVYTPDVYININEKLKILVLDESRGCPNSCFFCIHPVKSGRRRTKSPEKVIYEIKEYRKRYGVSTFKYAGSSTPGSFIMDVAKKILEDKIEVKYTSFGHLNEFEVDFSILKNSGCESIFFGLESADEKILKEGMNKEINIDKAKKVLIECKRAGIFTVVSVIYPAPFETRESRKKTMEFIKEVSPDSVLVQFAGVYPQTVWFKYPERFNFIIEDKETYSLKTMTYKIKNLFPPTYWEPLPYRINGMSFKDYARETFIFQKELQEEGIETSISDEAYLIYKVSGFSTLRDFLNTNRYYFYSGNRKKLEEEIISVNSRITRKE